MSEWAVWCSVHTSGLTCYTEVNLNLWLIIHNGMNLSVWLCKTEHIVTQRLWVLTHGRWHSSFIRFTPIIVQYQYISYLFTMKLAISLWQKSSTVKYIKKYSCFLKSTFFRKSSLFPNKEHPWGKIRRRD